jgi:TonB family protein
MSSRVPSTAVSGLLHAGAIVLVLLLSRLPQAVEQPLHRIIPLARDFGVWLPKTARPSDGGGGGGSHSTAPASLGRIARPAPRQFVPPAVETVNLHPALAIEPTIVAPADVVIPNLDMARYGLPNGVPGPPSGGRGGGGGIGDGEGPGQGDGQGPGAYSGRGGGVPSRGDSMTGAVTAPTLLWKSEPEYSEEARKAKVQGTVVLAVEVDAQGQVRAIQVRQSLGLGLDERAIEAVRRWKFRPGLRNGKPAPSPAVIHVNFRLL